MDRSNALGEREQPTEGLASTEGPASTEGLTLTEGEMRRLGYRAVDLIVDRWVSLRDDVAWAGGTRLAMESLFRQPAPE